MPGFLNIWSDFSVIDVWCACSARSCVGVWMNDRVEIIGERPVPDRSTLCPKLLLHMLSLLRACTCGGGLTLTCIVPAQQMTWATARRPRMWHSQTQSG